MRITNQTMMTQLRSGLRGRLDALARAERAAITGRRLRAVSDDPIDATLVMRLEAQVRDFDQYRRNGSFATTRLSAEDAAISSARDVLTRARQLAMSVQSDDPAEPQRQSALAAARQIRDELLSLSNTKMGGEYIFAGARGDAPAFAPDGTYQGDAVVRQIEIQANVFIAAGHAGEPAFGDALRAVDQLITELQTGTQASVQGTLAGLDGAMTGMLTAQAQTGVWLKEARDVGIQLAQQSAALLDRRDALRDVDPAEAVLELQGQQTALERAYAVVGRVLQASLVNYLS
jgi:flagellar hook-associated protein 3 FlgL